MIVKNKRRSKMNQKRGIDDHYLRHALARLPSASSEARRRLRLRTMLLGFALFGKEEEDLRLAKIWELKAWWRARGTYGFHL
jgi:hypothetical protein